jgi:hypothetical protein
VKSKPDGKMERLSEELHVKKEDITKKRITDRVKMLQTSKVSDLDVNSEEPLTFPKIVSQELFTKCQ